MQRFDSINVIPFVDILLVLLAMVLTTASFVNNGQLDLTLPSARAEPTAHEQQTTTIAIDRQGQHFLDGERVDKIVLQHRLGKLEPTAHVLLQIDETLKFSSFVSLIDLLKTLHLEQVSIETRKSS